MLCPMWAHGQVGVPVGGCYAKLLGQQSFETSQGLELVNG